jgi:predicted transcriptional regulator/DNA-binding XRE family transcriptional regulator
MSDRLRLGRKVRAARLEQNLSQASLAERLGISASYLNLIEHDRRPLTTALLLKVAQVLGLELRDLSAGSDAPLASDLAEVFSDPLFEDYPVTERELRELAERSPDLVRAIVRLHHGYTASRQSLDSMAQRLADTQDGAQDGGLLDDIPQDLTAIGRVRLSSEQVSDLLERHRNYFPELESEAARLWREATIDRENLFGSLSRHLQSRHGVTVRVRTVAEMKGAVRRYDRERRELSLSEVLRRGSRNFQLAHQIGLLECGATLDRIVADPHLTTDESRALARVALSSYFAAAVLMPYEAFFEAAEQLRYDIELLGHRFRASFEQVCHRLTNLHRPGSEGVAFHMVRVDIAGNLSKKFAPGGMRFPRFSGLCPLWSVHAAFLQPAMFRTQVSRLPDGTALFSVARTVRRHSGDFRTPAVMYAIALGCDLASARRVVYADGIDLANVDAAVPVGITCRTCERAQCEARAFPSLRQPLAIDENVRGVNFFAPVGRV